jgi:hypothetical protein
MRTTFSFARSASRPSADLLLGGIVYAIALAPALVGLPTRPEASAWAQCLGYVVVATVISVNVVSAVAIANSSLSLAQLALLVLSAPCSFILYLIALDWIVAQDAAELAFVGGLVGVDSVWVRRVLIVLLAAFLLMASLRWPAVFSRLWPYAAMEQPGHGEGKRASSSARTKSEDPNHSNNPSRANDNKGASANAHAGGDADRTGRDRSFRWTAGLCAGLVALMLVGTAFTSTPPRIGASDCAVLRTQQSSPDSATSKPSTAAHSTAKQEVPKAEAPAAETNKSAAPRAGPQDGRRGGPRPPP